MFQYNPTVNDNSGQIQAGYNTASSDLINSGINKATSNIMAAATAAMGKGQMTREELDMMGGGMDFLHQQGAVDGPMLEKFQSGSIGTKRGIYNMGQLQYANMLKQQNIRLAVQARVAATSAEKP